LVRAKVAEVGEPVTFVGFPVAFVGPLHAEPELRHQVGFPPGDTPFLSSECLRADIGVKFPQQEGLLAKAQSLSISLTQKLGATRVTDLTGPGPSMGGGNGSCRRGEVPAMGQPDRYLRDGRRYPSVQVSDLLNRFRNRHGISWWTAGCHCS
jgi:hypothetical protein